MAVLFGGIAGCGGSSRADNGSGPEPAADGAEPATKARPPEPPASDTSSKTAKATEQAAATTTTTLPPTPPTTDPTAPLKQPGPKGQLEMRASLADGCVAPGGTQSITIRTEPGSGVGYDTVYADGKSGLMEGHHGGNFGGHVDDDGRWSHTWIVAPTAPQGQVQVNVLGTHPDYGASQMTLFFTVSGPTGSC